MSRAHRTLRTTGVSATFTDTAAAAAALRRGDAALIVGALPFDPEKPAALTVPTTFAFTDGPWTPPEPTEQQEPRGLPGLQEPSGLPGLPGPPALPSVSIVGESPTPDVHRDRVAALIEKLSTGHLDKVVAARSILLQSQSIISPTALLARLVQQDHVGNGYGVNLSPAGGRFVGRTLVGSSPELLVRRHGLQVSAWPLAGSAPRHHDVAVDRAEAGELLGSAKNLNEHQFVVDSLRESLGPFCSELHVPDEPSLLGTPAVWHLGTHITGVLADPDVLAIDLAAAMHPTPAICGTPTDLAIRTIKETEDDRGFYAGVVGWCDSSGDGEWMVAIRCAEISADGHHARAYAGGGIVAGSDPHAELDETTAKLRTLLRAFGL